VTGAFLEAREGLRCRHMARPSWLIIAALINYSLFFGLRIVYPAVGTLATVTSWFPSTGRTIAQLGAELGAPISHATMPPQTWIMELPFFREGLTSPRSARPTAVSGSWADQVRGRILAVV
jgi:hypothetical protein